MKNPILTQITRIAFPFIMALGFYVQINGSDAPGGGFQAGVIMASAFILVCMVFGVPTLTSVLNMRRIKLLAVLGVLLYGVTGLLCMIFGAEFLNYNVLQNSFFDRQTLGISMIEWGVGITVFSVFTLCYYLFATSGGKVND